MATVYFDDSLDLLVGTVVNVLGEGALEKGVILRDATGRLSFVCPFGAGSEEKRQQADKYLREALQAYARDDRVILFSGDEGADRLLTDSSRLYVQIGKHFCQVIDRRIVGAGWLDAPADVISTPLRVVFASLKGGVGRTTALAVAASDLASRGRNVLVVDLDLEAPGLGELMLDVERTPRFGVLDYLVENGIGGVSQSELDAFIGLSKLTDSSGGRVDVVPALGTRSSELPQNILPKLARAMIEDIAKDGSSKSVGRQISTMIDRLTERGSYDVVLIDSRAGLAEIAAPAVLGLGAIVLLFGTAQRQTIAGYRALFSALKLLAVRELQQGRTADWRLLFRPVYAKASLEPQIGRLFASELYELFAENLYDREVAGELTDSDINFSTDDPDAPHRPLVIPFDPRFVDFDPSRNRSHLGQTFYEQTYRPFLKALDDLMTTFGAAGDVDGERIDK
jgi:MinD-like ATPase involved in chromosome partitioning or flagellar assembly